jgi:hypothetical protein
MRAETKSSAHTCFLWWRLKYLQEYNTIRRQRSESGERQEPAYRPGRWRHILFGYTTGTGTTLTDVLSMQASLHSLDEDVPVTLQLGPKESNERMNEQQVRDGGPSRDDTV